MTRQRDDLADQRQANSVPEGRRGVWLTAGAALLAVIGLGLAGGFWYFGSTYTPQLLAEARQALASGDFPQAERLALRLTERKDAAAEGWLLAGDAAAGQNRFDDALRHYAQVPAGAGKQRQTALVSSGDVLLAQGRLSRAMAFYQQALRANSANLAAHDRLAFLLGLQGRSYEAAEHRLILLRNRQFSADYLVLLAMEDRTTENSELVEAFLRETPDDPQALCGAVRQALRENRRADAARSVAQVLQHAPDLLQAQAWQGSLLVAEGKDEEFLAWHAALPAAADGFPEIWRQRADWARLHGETRSAIRCYWEAARLDPNHLAVHYQLAQLLAAEGESEQAAPFLERAQRLEKLVGAARTFHVSRDPQTAAMAAELTEQLGRFWEALGWRHLLRGDGPATDATQAELDRLLTEALREPEGRARAAAQPARQIDLSAYPLPQWRTAPAAGPGSAREPAPFESDIAFADLASAVGLDFRYVDGNTRKSGGAYYYEHDGGGVAVLDYDGDGWPDLHLTQGCLWPPAPGQNEHLDRLYRNLAGSHFVDVTAAARIFENGYSQGATVGDYDNDGFDDLYVCNIGGNRLFHNNGDGTFSDVTDAAQVAGKRWSTSCALADMNGDALPDLYVVNYLEGEELFNRPCETDDGDPALCTPHEFPAAPDEFYLNLGDGRFAEALDAAGMTAPEGKGLGVVAADLEGAGRLAVFVANDATPNFCFKPDAAQPDQPPHFVETALLAGLAVDAEGRSQACMGVACGDANGDCQADLFITNFRDESNTLYLQSTPGQFLDETRRAGLREPSYALVGFGAQFLDADLDGWLDLVLTNGHVGDLSSHGLPYRMRPQFFRNAGGGEFEELAAQTLGPFFEREYVGRSLARVDWNRDGLDDFVVSHLDAPAALVTNQTRGAGHFLALRLRGVDASRDAIGATAVLTSGTEQWTAQLTAGDGYQARNERVLRFGLGARDRIDRVEIRWPSGARQTLEAPALDTELLVIEGQEKPIALPLPR